MIFAIFAVFAFGCLVGGLIGYQFKNYELRIRK